jgi:NADPH-dependent 2,4-dienoyl-CoA reductase/sulfur reductase-like enzyme/nitrite reductase/ring-hydroxylating ferredoxin subunit
MIRMGCNMDGASASAMNQGTYDMKQHDVASLNELSDGQILPITVDDTEILLIRRGDAIHAIGATCPHAGAPLAEGICTNEQIICPWHKATFSIRTGALLEPPAVDDLPCYHVEQRAGRILITLPAHQPDPPKPSQDHRLFAIIGAGAAGALAAQTLRQAGFGGRIVMLDQENRVPYDRTLLSKYHLSGESGAEKTPLQPQSFYQQHAIERLTAKVENLDAARKTIRDTEGRVWTYDSALLATGAAPHLPALPGAHLGNVFLLRSKADADAILAQAERSQRAVILGASFIGMEVAASLRERGLEVTVVGQQAAPFEKQLGPTIGAAFVGLHAKRGVGFRLKHDIQALEGDQTVQGVTLSTGEYLPADLVVIGFGVKPVTSYLTGVALHDDGGIPVDATLRAADGLYAAGDIARFPYRGQSIRVEHWRVAQQHGRIAALNMLGQNVSYDSVPVFWTIQYLKRLDYIGHAEDWDDIVLHGDLKKPEFLAYFVKSGRVVAAVGLDRDQETAALIVLLQQHQDWTPEALGDKPSTLLQP